MSVFIKLCYVTIFNLTKLLQIRFIKGGDLIEAMQTGGQIAVENLIREQFGVFMYKGGKGQIINRAEYLRWKYKDNTEVRMFFFLLLNIFKNLKSHKNTGYNSDRGVFIIARSVIEMGGSQSVLANAISWVTW